MLSEMQIRGIMERIGVHDFTGNPINFRKMILPFVRAIEAESGWTPLKCPHCGGAVDPTQAEPVSNGPSPNS